MVKNHSTSSSTAPRDSQYWAVIPAAGVGKRCAGDRPKQYQPLLQRPVAQWALERLLAVVEIQRCVVALNPDDGYWQELPIDKLRVELTCGGAERADSVRQALRALEGSARPQDWVLVHDIARPCVRSDDIRRLMTELAHHPVGGILAAPIADTVKRVNSDGSIVASEDRKQLWSALTPQMFRYSLLCDALDRASQSGLSPTDEAAAVEAIGHHPLVVEGQRDNIKITRREDLAIAEAILRSQEQVL